MSDDEVIRATEGKYSDSPTFIINSTTPVGVSGVAGPTATGDNVIPDVTVGVDPAGRGTRVDTLEVLTDLVRPTLRVGCGKDIQGKKQRDIKYKG